MFTRVCDHYHYLLAGSLILFAVFCCCGDYPGFHAQKALNYTAFRVVLLLCFPLLPFAVSVQGAVDYGAQRSPLRCGTSDLK